CAVAAVVFACGQAPQAADPSPPGTPVLGQPQPAPPPDVSISISPARAQTTTSGALSFSAIVTGTTDTDAMWSVAEGSAGGSIDSHGLYTAPPTAGTYHVIATAHGDPNKSVAAEVTVTASLSLPPQQDQV